VDGQKYENEMKRHTAFLILKHLGHASGLGGFGSLCPLGTEDVECPLQFSGWSMGLFTYRSLSETSARCQEQ
jgi:hypothetical protein